MKKVLLALAALMMSVGVFAKKDQPALRKVSERLDIVYLKVSCPMLGGTIEVYNAAGLLIHSQTITGHKVIVDFYAEPSGNYTIQVRRDNILEQVQYSKTTHSQSVHASLNHISITQL